MSLAERTLEVTSEFDGWRLDVFLAARIHRLSRSKATRLCRDGEGLRLEPSRRVKPSLTLRAGDVVHLTRPDERSGQVFELPILYQDRHVLVVDKPTRLLVMPTARVFTDTVVSHLRGLAEALGDDHLEPVHRLDKGTSGALMVARRVEAVPALRGLFDHTTGEDARRKVDKRYLAVVADPAGLWAPGAQEELTAPLGFAEGARLKIRMGRGSLPSHTSARCLSRAGEVALVSCALHTGRQHQIRVHLALFGTPVMGDPIYQMGEDYFLSWLDADGEAREAMEATLPWPRLALHAHSLAYVCPFEGRRVEVVAPVPEGFPAPEWSPPI